MLKYSYLFLLLLLISCTKDISNNEVKENNLDNKEVIVDSIDEETLIDETTDKDIDELIDILFDTNY